MLLTRREKLLGLVGLAACAPKPISVAPVPDGGVTLGWRWVPGQRLRYRVVSERIAGPPERAVTVSRAEEWQYLVTDLDSSNIAHIEGRLMALGAGIAVGGESLPDTVVEPAAIAERRGGAPVLLEISMDGRLLHCSEPGFAAALPHQMLALRVPRTPVAAYDEWSDPALSRPFAALLPMDLAVSASGTTRLLEFSSTPPLMASLELQGSIRTTVGGPAITVSGTARWDTTTGRLASRTLTAHFTPDDDDPIQSPGRLSVHTRQI